MWRTRKIIPIRRVTQAQPLKRTVYAVYQAEDPDSITTCYSIEDILDKFPEMKRKGINLVLSGKQKSHVGYRIRKEEY